MLKIVYIIFYSYQLEYVLIILVMIGGMLRSSSKQKGSMFEASLEKLGSFNFARDSNERQA